MPEAAHRVGLRACAAVGRGCREALRGVADPGATRVAIIRLGEEAGAELAEIPDTPALRRSDGVLGAALRGPLVRRLQRLVARYRDECNSDSAIIELTIAEAYARCIAEGMLGGSGDPRGDRGGGAA